MCGDGKFRMKVAVITRHAISNYGSLLQAMATQKIISDFGCECQIIDYIRDDEAYRNQEKTLLKRKPSFNKNLLKRFVYLAFRKPESVFAGKRFEKMRRKYLNLTKEYSDIRQLKDAKPAADVYMTGSDQVWGPVMDGTYDSETFFHQFARSGKLKCCPDISGFLSYIKNAKCLITDSFHGTAFAINFNTPFVEVLPDVTSTRNVSILRLTGLTDRVLRDESDVELAFKPIDFSFANQVLEDKRKEGMAILSEMLGVK